jgi:predicted ribonuclease YlaK
MPRNSKKIFVLDTSVILYSHYAFYSFADNDVAIPITVLEELTALKEAMKPKILKHENLSGLWTDCRSVIHYKTGFPLTSCQIMGVSKWLCRNVQMASMQQKYSEKIMQIIAF